MGELPGEGRKSMHVGESKILCLVTKPMWPKLLSLTSFPKWNPELAQSQVKVSL